MFRPAARWWNEKKQIKVFFKLQFRVSQLTETGGDGVIVSVVPADTGKPSLKTDKVAVREGSCVWENPLYETVKFSPDLKAGKIQERIYYFVVGTGLSGAGGVFGEACIDFSNYVDAIKASSVSLPLKNSKTNALLHVSIQRVRETGDQREDGEMETAELYMKDQCFKSQSSNHDIDGAIESNFVEDMTFSNVVSPIAEANGNCGASCSGSDATMSSSESSSGGETPLEVKMKNGSCHDELESGVTEEHARSWEWLGNSAPEASTDDSSSTPMGASSWQKPEEAPAIVIKKLRSELATLSRQAEMSEVELQTLRRQIVKESKRGQDLWIEIICLKEERDALKGECERFKAFQRRADESKTKSKLLCDSQNAQAIVEELREELDHLKELNGNLRIQLQKTQESNSELILAVQDLEVLLEQKNRETSSGRLLTAGMEKRLQGDAVCQSDDDEQKALEELVRGHSNAKEADLLEQIMDLHSEIETYKRDNDDLEMQMEQLALDYEIMKQENHELSRRLEQSQIQEKLKMQYGCTAELESQLEEMENELERRSKEYEDSLVTIRELETRAERLEEELEKQRKGFEIDLEAVTCSKVEQEHRATRAEELLKKLQWKNAGTAERLQEEFRKLSSQMSSTFEANEKLATKAMAEANELRSQKCHMEKMLEQMSEENQSVKEQYEARLHQYSSQVKLMENQIQQMQLEIEERSAQLNDQKKCTEETEKILSDEILMLKEEVEMHAAKTRILLEDVGRKETLLNELECMKRSMKETELVVEQGNDERIELENHVGLMKNEVKEAHEELHNMRCLVKQKELVIGNLRAEVDLLQTQCKKCEQSLNENEVEKEKLRKQVLQLISDLKKRDELSKIKKKIKDGNSRGTPDILKGNSKPSKLLPHGSKEVTNLKERIKLLEDQIKSKDKDLTTSANTFHEMEKELHNKIAELEERVELLNKSNAQFIINEVENINAVVQRQASSCTQSEESRNNDDNLEMNVPNVNDHPALTTKRKEKVRLERDASMEKELKEMHDRYSEMSLKFAEVEGERQQLLMELRSLKNPNK